MINLQSIQNVNASSVSRAAGSLNFHRSLVINELGNLTSGGRRCSPQADGLRNYILTNLEMFVYGKSSLTGICALT